MLPALRRSDHESKKKHKPAADDQRQDYTLEKLNQVQEYESRNGRSHPVSEEARKARNSMHMEIDSTGPPQPPQPPQPSQPTSGPSGPIPSAPTTLLRTLRPEQPTTSKDTRNVVSKRYPYDTERSSDKPRAESGRGSSSSWGLPGFFSPYASSTTDINTELCDARGQIRDLEKDIQSLKAESFSREKVYNARIEDLQRIVDEQTQKVQRAQDAAFRLMNQSRPEADDDTVIRRKFGTLAPEWRRWARDYATEDLKTVEKFLAGSRKEEYLETVAGFVRLDGGRFPQKLLDVGRAGPSIMLHAMLASFICRNIFEAPFFFLENRGHQKHSPFRGEEEDGDGEQPDDHPLSSPSQIYAKLLEVSEKDAHLWRSDTLRLLTPRDESLLSQPALNALATVKSLQSNAYEQLTKLFLGGPAGTVLLELSEAGRSQRYDALLRMISEAGALSCRLWTQRTKIECWSLPRFVDEPFAVGGKWMKAHVSHRLEEDDPKLDGWRVGVVVQPAVVAFGNEDAEGYCSVPRCWMEAVVWLTDDGVKGAGRGIRG